MVYRTCHMEESDSHPFYLCPICLQKLFFARIRNFGYFEKLEKAENLEKEKKVESTSAAGDEDVEETNRSREEKKEEELGGGGKGKKPKRKWSGKGKGKGKGKGRRRVREKYRPPMFDLIERYRRLSEWCGKVGMDKEKAWYEARIASAIEPL